MNKKLSRVEVAYHVISEVTKAIHCAVPDRDMPMLCRNITNVIEREKLESRIEELEWVGGNVYSYRLDGKEFPKDRIDQLKNELKNL